MAKKIGEFQSTRWCVVDVVQSTYLSADGPTAILLESGEHGPLCRLSVNMYRPDCSQDSRELPPNCFYMKDWGQEDLAAEAQASGLFKLRTDLAPAESGHVQAQAWEIIATKKAGWP
jgi:hypothetical protein